MKICQQLASLSRFFSIGILFFTAASLLAVELPVGWCFKGNQEGERPWCPAKAGRASPDVSELFSVGKANVPEGHYLRNPPKANKHIILASAYSSGTNVQVPSAMTGLTAVFGMGTGVPPSPKTPR